MIRLNDEQYWLYAAVDPEIDELPHTIINPTTNKGIAHTFFAELREKHDVDDSVFLIDGSHSLKDACRRHSLDFRYERHGNRNSVERSSDGVSSGIPAERTPPEPRRPDFGYRARHHRLRFPLSNDREDDHLRDGAAVAPRRDPGLDDPAFGVAAGVLVGDFHVHVDNVAGPDGLEEL